MSTFEKKLARFREEQARRNERQARRDAKELERINKPMAQSHRKEVVKALRVKFKEAEEAGDTKLMLQISNEMSKFLPKPKQPNRRPVKPAVSSPSAKPKSLREIYTGSVFDAMSDGELVFHHLVEQLEKRRKAGECETDAEREAFKKEVLISLGLDAMVAYADYKREREARDGSSSQ